MGKVTGIIVQARMGSVRLPRKVAEIIEGKTVLEHVIDRLGRVKGVKIILATTTNKEDDVLEKIANDCGIIVFRGSEANVLDRFYRAAQKHRLDHIVRITADCPVIDHKIVERTMNYYFKNNFDYVSNSHPPTFPDGMDVEIFSFKSLERAWNEAAAPEDTEHVTPYILKNPQYFKIGNFKSDKSFYGLRITLDEREDLDLITKIYKELYKENPAFGLAEIINLFEKKPELKKINQKVTSHPISRWKKNQKKI